MPDLILPAPGTTTFADRDLPDKGPDARRYSFGCEHGSSDLDVLVPHEPAEGLRRLAEDHGRSCRCRCASGLEPAA